MIQNKWDEMAGKPCGVAAAHSAAWDITRQLEYAAETCLYEPAAALMRNAKDEIERRRWIPVTERLPESGETVLVWHHGEVQMAWLNHFTNGVAYFVRDTHYNFEPTHWMPLPAPPTDAK